MRHSLALWAATAALAATGSAAASGVGAAGIGAHRAAASACPNADWPQYGGNPDHTFAVANGCSAISATNVATMIPKWFFHTQDSVTASPAVVGNSVYVGAWNGQFYSLNARTGQQQWVFDIRTVNPVAFGQIVSSAAVVPVPVGDTGRTTEVVFFGGGSRLWALAADTGKLLAFIDLDPRKPKLRKAQLSAPNPPTVEIESSPAVAEVPVDGKLQQRIYVGLDVHNDSGVGRTGVVALRLVSTDRQWSFQPLWKSDAETDRTYYGRAGLTEGSGQGQGCGDVWSSPAVDAADDVLVYGVGNCDHPPTAKAHHQNWAESLMAVDATTGKFLWRYSPAEHQGSASAGIKEAYLDDDFGASVNIYRDDRGRVIAGDGSKGGVYYAMGARTGRPMWQKADGSPGNLSEDFAVGGFIGSLAVASNAAGVATEIVGGTAIPIPFPKNGGNLPGSLEDIHSFDANTGRVLWSDRLVVPTYGSTSIVNDVALLPLTVASSVVAVDLKTGLPLWVGPVLGPPSSTAVVSGSSIYLGTGTNETDLEYKALNLAIPPTLERTIGQSPLSPLSGVQAFQLAGATG